MPVSLSTMLMSRLVIATVEFLILGLLVVAVLGVCRGITPRWRRRIWLVVLCKPVITFATASFDGLVHVPGFVSGRLLSDLMFAASPADSPLGGGDWLARLLGITLNVWVIVAMILLLRLMIRVARGQQFANECREKGYLLKRSALRSMDASLQVPSSVRIIVTYEDHGPVTVGMFRRSVIIPETLLPWVIEHRDASAEERGRLSQILRHELAHVSACDYAVSVAANVVLSIFWFHPIAHWAYRRIRINSELCCDMTVVEGGVEPASYANTLLNVVSDRVARRGLALGIVGDMSPASVLRRRLHFVLSEFDEQAHTRSFTAYLLIIALLVALPRTLAQEELVKVLLANGDIREVSTSEADQLIAQGAMALDATGQMPRHLHGRDSTTETKLADRSHADTPDSPPVDLPESSDDTAPPPDVGDISADDDVLAQADETIEENPETSESDAASSGSEHGHRIDGLDDMPERPFDPLRPPLRKRP